MKKLILLLTLFLSLSAAAFAQHCPYDGYYMIVARLTDENDQSIKNAEISLREIDNPQAASCAFSRGLLNKLLVPSKTLLDDYFGEDLPRGSAVKRFCADCTFLGEGYYAVILESSEESCKLYDSGNNLTSRKRKFEIHYGEQTIPVEQSSIYPLCRAQGKWSRIEPVKHPIKTRKTSESSTHTHSVEEITKYNEPFIRL